MARRLSIFILIILAATLSWTCAGYYVHGRIRQEVVRRLPQRVGPARSYSVESSGSLIDLLQGRLRQISLLGRGVRLRNGITLDQLDVDARGISFDISTASISEAERADFAASVSQKSLQGYLVRTRPEVPDLTVALPDGSFEVTGTVRIGRRPVRVRSTGTLEIAGDSLLIARFYDVNAVGLRSPEVALRALESRLNPLLDSSTWSIRAELKSVRISDGKVELRGVTSLNR